MNRETGNDETKSPPSKRQRLIQQQSTTDDSTELLKFLDGDDFVTEQQRQDAAAQRRRLLRRQRLQQRAQQQDEEQTKAMESTKQPPPKQESMQNGTTNKAKIKPESKMKPEAWLEKQEVEENNLAEKEDDDDFDMFSSSVSPVDDTKSTVTATNATRGHGQEDYDDAEGYYKAVIGEVINLEHTVTASDRSSTTSAGSMSFRVSGVIGKGVFSTVLKCSTTSNSTSVEIPPTIAMKFIRHNETMAKAAASEIQILQRLKGSPGIVPLLLPTTVSTLVEYRGHVILAFPFMEYNLREVLQKFGKGVGLSLQAVRSYFGQLLAAATHLKKHEIIHADLKPDNILVSADFSIVQLADFGSAVDTSSPEGNIPTPYLVSRFYRAPEIILGLPPTFAVDLWSIAVTVAELFLGEVLFQGKSNNNMLYVFMQHLGAFSNRVIRQHLVQYQKLPIPRHFQQEGASYYFTQQTVDPVTGEPVKKVLSLLPQNNSNKFPSATPLNSKLLRAKSAKDARSMVVQFSDLLQKCLALDPTRRIAIKDALRHPFFQTEAASKKN